MALTNDLLRGNAATSALSDDVIAAIVEMSRNDENAVIGQKTGEIYGGLDTDILNASGIGKNGVEKTYEYAKRVIGEIKAKADESDGLRSQVAELTKEKTRLEKAIADGGADAEIKKELAKAKADLGSVTKEYTDLKSRFDAQEDAHAKALFALRLDGEFAKATAGVKLKKDIPEGVSRLVIEQAVNKVREMSPEYVDDGKGGKVLAFMENGAIMRNPENNLNPFTAAELVTRELRTMGVLEVQKTQTGTGITPQPGAPSGGFDFSAARTQGEAYDAIVRAVQDSGKKIGSPEFERAVSEAWKANRDVIKTLPLQ